MADLLFPKDPPKKKRKKHGKSIMPAYGGCWLCRFLDDDDRKKVTEVHHIYFGPNRSKSEEYGYNCEMTGFAANETLEKHYVENFDAIRIHMLHPYQILIPEEAGKRIKEIYTYEWTDDEL